MPGPLHKIAHLVVHMHDSYREYLVPEDHDVPERIEAFIERTGDRFPPIYTLVEQEGDTLALQHLKSWSLAQGMAPQVHKSYGQLPSAFDYKRYNSITLPSDLESILRRMDAGTCVLSGGNRRDCLWQTALSAKARGYRVVILDDLCFETPGYRNSSRLPEITPEYAASHGIEFMSSSDFLRPHLHMAAKAAPQVSRPLV